MSMNKLTVLPIFVYALCIVLFLTATFFLDTQSIAMGVMLEAAIVLLLALFLMK